MIKVIESSLFIDQSAHRFALLLRIIYQKILMIRTNESDINITTELINEIYNAGHQQTNVKVSENKKDKLKTEKLIALTRLSLQKLHGARI